MEINDYIEIEMIDINLDELPEFFFEKEDYEKMEFYVEREENGGYVS